MKYVVYATNKNGRGFVQQIGEYEDVSEISIMVGHFADDVEITISEKIDEN